MTDQPDGGTMYKCLRRGQRRRTFDVFWMQFKPLHSCRHLTRSHWWGTGTAPGRSIRRHHNDIVFVDHVWIWRHLTSVHTSAVANPTQNYHTCASTFAHIPASDRTSVTGRAATGGLHDLMNLVVIIANTQDIGLSVATTVSVHSLAVTISASTAKSIYEHQAQRRLVFKLSLDLIPSFRVDQIIHWINNGHED